MYKTLFLFVFAACLTQVQAITFTNNTRTTFNASEGNELLIINKYGQITVDYISSDSVIIDTNISVTMPTKEDSASFFNNVTTEHYLNRRTIVGKTVFNSDYQSIYDYAIDYHISLPETYKLDLRNQFGNIVLPYATSDVKIKLDYGKLVSSNFLNKNNNTNELELNYAEAILDTVSTILIKAQTAIVNIKMAHNTILHSQYSKFIVAEADIFSGESYFDNINIVTCNSFTCLGEYSEFVIEKLTSDLESSMNYGALTIHTVTPNFKSIGLNNKYVTTRISFEPTISYIINADMQYCKIDIPQPNTISKVKEQFLNSVNGIVGENPNTKATVSVVSRFGDVFLLKL